MIHILIQRALTAICCNSSLRQSFTYIKLIDYIKVPFFYIRLYSYCMRRIFLLLFFTLGYSCSAFSQLYFNQQRPPAQNWQELRTEHFRIIYPAEAESVALRAGRILEIQYPVIQNTVGGNLRYFPFVLNTENDRSNGFVTPINFRSEVEVPPIKGKIMNPSSGDWLELVLPHELVHALHMNVNPGSLTSLIGIFSPDLRRSVHTAAPLGILEGIAVEHESHGAVEEGGRGNHPYFSNRFSSNFVSDDRWSMGQLFHVSSSTLPFDRHYVGAYEFTHWLQHQYGDDTFKKAIEFHYRWPFLGFGMALRHTTGQWPGALYRSFTDDMDVIEEEKISSYERSTTGKSYLPDHGKKGAVIRRPLWINDRKLVMHGTYYNAPTGFYIYDFEENSFTLLLEHQTVEDFRFSINENSREIYFADYVTDGLYHNTFRSRLFSYNIETGEKTKIAPDNRLFSPSPGSPFYALQSTGSGNRLLALDTADGTVELVADLGEQATIEEVQQHSIYKDHLAIIARKQSVQALWITNPDMVKDELEDDPDIVFADGSVFDLAWHPEERKLLFSSDHTGILNVYEYDIEAGKVTQITRSLYNAYEASYSPDGSRIAYILQEDSKQFPAILDNDNYDGTILPADEWRPAPEIIGRMHRPLMESDEQPDESAWVQMPYRTGLSWLRPRTVLPQYNERVSGTHEIGLQFLSVDPLNRHTYSLTASGVQNRLWLDFDYEYSGFYPGFGISLFNSPAFPLIRDSGEELEDSVRFLLQERGISLKIPIRYTFRRNTRLTSVSFIPEYSISQVRFFGLNTPDNALNDYGNFNTIKLNAIFNFRLRQFRRDFQPNAGWVLFARTDYDINDLPFSFNYNDLSFDGTFMNRKGLRLGLFSYISPLGRWNQSLRLGAQVLTQTEIGKYNLQGIVSNAFDGDVFLGANNAGIVSTRYTIPLAYPDDGGFLIPAYLSNLYVVLFSQTVGDLNRGPFPNIVNSSRTALGAGIRSRVRLSNFTIDFGIGLGYEPSRNQWSLILGDF